MKNIPIAVILFMVCIMITSSPVFSECDYDGSLAHLWFTDDITFTHVVEESPINILHKKVSKEDRDKYNHAIDLYGKQEYGSSLKIITELHVKYPDDVYIHEFYSKVLYRIPDKKEQCYKSYKSLIDAINKHGYDELRAITNKPVNKAKQAVINTSFLEVYWKIGCLHMDYQNYRDAYVELSKVVLIINRSDVIARDNPQLLVDCYSYLTEASYFLKDKKNNEYFYCRTKKFDPENTYVEKYILK